MVTAVSDSLTHSLCRTATKSMKTTVLLLLLILLSGPHCAWVQERSGPGHLHMRAHSLESQWK